MAGAPDQRDTRTWVVLELTRAGEAKVEEGTIETLLREALGIDRQHQVFIPSITYHAAGRQVTLHLMEGYAFVASGLSEAAYFDLESSCPYVKRVLSSRGPRGMRTLQVIPESSVQDMRSRLAQQIASDVQAGMQVVVTDGTYTKMEGRVIDLYEDHAHVEFVLRSIDIIARIPTVFLRPSEEVD